MTRSDLVSQLLTINAELHRLTLAIEEVLQPIRAEVLLSSMVRLETRVDELIDALPTLEEAP